MTVVQDLVTSISTEMQAELGATYSPLQYSASIEKNNFNANNNRYSVLAYELSESNTVSKNVTVSQTFELILTKSYYQSMVSDDGATAIGHELQSKMLDIYKRLVNNKAGLPLVVLNISDVSLTRPEYIEESKVCVVRANFLILYRFSLI